MSTAQVSAGPVFSVVYVSSATRLFSEQELIGLLRVSRNNNQRDAITGMLLYKDGNFLQALEGPESAVRRRLEIIRQDPRHRCILSLTEKHQTERNFLDWSMGFRNLMALDEEDLKTHNPLHFSSLLDHRFRETPSASYQLLRSFKNSM